MTRKKKEKSLVKRSYWVEVEQAAKVTRESKKTGETESAIMRKILEKI